MSNETITYASAVQAIKTAILQGQYEAAKGAWGMGALKAISEQLRILLSDNDN